jgi:hypothetical protein
VTCRQDSLTRSIIGAACACGAECASGFCVDGVCCDSVCGETCKSCKTSSAPGICSFVAAGNSPRSPDVCPQTGVSSCGLDGTCDGKGECRSYVTGSVCQAGSCVGASVGGVRVCDGAGSCVAGPETVCAPFGCDATTHACVTRCVFDSDCAPSVKCVNGSCGKRLTGAVCNDVSQCASGYCVDGFCCNSACSGPCVSCSLSGRTGSCSAIAVGVADPRAICLKTDASTCGLTGVCDGVGGCTKYAPETVCSVPSCSGGRLNTAGTCDGLGTCRPPGVEDCAPFGCASGACISRCTNDNDCASGHSCVNGSCGAKMLGQPCSASSECASSFCADGVCCATACAGSCRSCALSTSLGTCSPVSLGAVDPHDVCIDHRASSCATDGTCDGTGGCRTYPAGTECAPETCAAGIYTPASTCDTNGNCRAPDEISCAPYICNGARCYAACGSDASCSNGNACLQGSCGPKPNGAFCSAGSECQSGQCAQGVCCTTTCADSCFSCAVAGSMGRCITVPTGQPDPAAVCADQGAASCGSDGKCQSGTCQKYQQGTACSSASCRVPGSTFTAAGTCDGAGSCKTPAPISCFPFICGLNACESACTSDGDCAQGQYCSAGSCGLKSNGAVCQQGTDCQSAVCSQGVCCATACTGSCMSCALAGGIGTCSPVPIGGSDPTSLCKNQGAASCGTTGFCNGAGGCQLYAAGTQCAAPSCPASSTIDTLVRTCDGAGTCKPATTQSCFPFTCNATTQTACVSVCASDADCAPGQFCNAGSCGLRRLGQICGSGSDCASSYCVDGVCCSAPGCGTCQACNLSGSTGSCQPVPAGSTEPHQLCPLTPPCGFDGTCNGAGTCRNTKAGTGCGATTCTGSTSMVSACNGAGTCAQTSLACPGHFVCGPAACLTTCASDADCVAGYTCQSNTCTNLKPLGSACASSGECINGMCTDHVCCASASCGACNACNIAGKVGTCAPVASGSPDPAGLCTDTGSASCGTTGICDGTGQCARYPAGTICAAAACKSGKTSTLIGTSKCDGAGKCVTGPTTDCSPQACISAACTIGCKTVADCAPGYNCKSIGDGGANQLVCQ